MTAALLLALQAAAPTLDLEAGHQGAVFRDSWSRLTAIVQNPGDEREFELRLVVRGAAPEQSLVRRIAFPARSKRKLTWDVWFEGDALEAAAELADAQGRVLTSRAVPLRGAAPARRQILLAGAPVDALRPFEDDAKTVLRTAPELLPDDVVPLLAADAIVFAEPVALEGAQEEALLRWVERGGTLAFSAGTFPAALRRPFWRDVSPAELGPPARVERPDGPPTTLAPARPKAGARTILEVAGRPAGFRLRRGAGAVLVYACPMEDVGSALVDEIVGPPAKPDPPPPPPPGRPGWTSAPTGPRLVPAVELRRDLSKPRPERRPPSLLLGLLGLGSYAALVGPGTWLWLRRRGRARGGRSAFVLLTAGALAFTAAWGGLGKPRAPLTAHVIYASPDLVQTFSEVHAGDAGVHRLAVDGHLASSNQHDTWWTGRLRRPPVHGERGRLDLPLASLESRSVVAARAPRPGEIAITAAWVDRPAGRVEVRNAGGWPLREAAIVAGLTAFPVGDLGAGDVRRIDLAGGVPLAAWAERMGWAQAPSVWARRQKTRPALSLGGDAACGVPLRERVEAAMEVRLDRLGVRGLDRSADERPLLVGRFDADLSGLELAPAGEVEVRGVLTVAVEDP